ncbi:SDR family NAD(P)-dependent oxidoreductase [Cryptosporangium phraense]|uniref:SDR family NAD(P)-dependent oxidoreductase n=1 Tax=Cryptosporangium phraense TaxID=2593070 RepID=UPI001478437B|nr:SDR family oxidoreductase [Cryptosporangium phraense]
MRILVTGAAQGIGKAVTLRLAADGEDLVLFDRNEEGLASTVKEATDAGAGSVQTYVVDVREHDRLRELAERLDGEEPFDGLVNVAGVGLMSKFPELSLEQWQWTFDINVAAPFVLSQAIGVRMAARGRGRIVVMASIAGKGGSAELADYCASKAAAISLTQSLARALGPSGVTANAVCPGLVWTPMWEATGSWLAANQPAFASAGMSNHEAFLATVKASTPLQRPTRPEDIAATVRFLLSDDAELITGQAINVDGGIEVH